MTLNAALCWRCIFALAVLAFSVQAEEAEIVEVAAPSGKDVPKDPEPKPKPKETEPEIPADPLFEINRRLHATSNAAADIVEVGSGPDLLPRGTGKLQLATEEAGPVIRAPMVRRANDPEARRLPGDLQTANEGELAGETPAVRAAPRAPRRGDPELMLRKFDGADDEPAATATQPAVRPPQPAAPPRFVAGEGLDSEAAEEVARALHAPKPVEAPAATANTETPANPAETPTLLSEQPKLPAEAANAAGLDKTAFDPEKVFADLIAKVAREKEATKAKLNAPPEKTPDTDTANVERIRVRDRHAAMALDILYSKTPLGAVSGRVLDAATGLPIPVRVKLTDRTDLAAQGEVPEGFWTDGAFRAEALSGPANLEISRGRFYPSFTKAIDIPPNAQVVVGDVTLTRAAMLNFAARGWYLADLDMGLRAARGEPHVWFGQPPSLADLVRAARGEDVKIVGVPMPWGDGDQARSLEHLQQAQGNDVLLLPVFPGPNHLFHGTAFSLGLKSWEKLPQELVDPELPLRESFEDVRARGGLVAYKALGGARSADIKRDILPFFPRMQQSNYFGNATGRTRLYAAAELPFDTVVGPAYDLLTFDGSPTGEKIWFNLLQQGYTMPVVGSGGGSLQGGRMPMGQTFVNVKGELTAAKALDAIKKGETTISFGPAVFCRILERDMGPGSVLPVDNRTLTLQIEAYASMAKSTQLDRIEIIRNGEVVSTQTASDGETYISDLRVPLVTSSNSWIVVRVTERRIKGKQTEDGGRAWTNPIFFRNATLLPPTPAVSRVRGQLSRGLTPVTGTVSVIAPGQPKRVINTDKDGRYKLEAPSTATLIFEAAECEPVARRIFQHPLVQRELGALQAEENGALVEKLADPNLTNRWKYILADLPWDVALPAAPAGR